MMNIAGTDTPSYADIFDGLPDAVVWARPVRNSHGDIVDFEICFCNKKADEAIDHPKGSIKGMCIRRDGIPAEGSLADENFKHYLQVYQNEGAGEHSFRSPSTNKAFDMQRRKYQDGVLSITRDRSALREAEQREKEQAELLRNIVQNAPAGIVTYEAVRNVKGEIVDFKAKIFNHEVNRLAGFTDEERSTLTLRQLLIGTGVEDNFSRYKHTVETGEPFSLVFFYRRTIKWLHFFGVKFGDGFISILTDYTEKIQQEQTLQRHSDYLNSILNTSQNAINTMEAIRDAEGRIGDLRYVQINRGFEQIIGLQREQVLGRTMLELFPTTVEAGVLDAYRRAIETGELVRLEIYYKGEHLDAWFDLSIARLDQDTAVGTFNDITQSKKARIEIEQQRNLLDTILKYSPGGITVLKTIRDEQGAVTDFQCILANEAAVQQSGLSKELMMTQPLSKIEPGFLGTPYFSNIIEALREGPASFTQYYVETTGRWLELSAVRLDEDHVINAFTDITAIKAANEEIERLADQLSRFINTSLTGLSLFKPVFDEKGDVVDFRYDITNDAFAMYSGKLPEELKGKLVSDYFPTYKTNGDFDVYRRTYLTGESIRRQAHYYGEGLDAWFDTSSTKMEEGVLITISNITDVKRLQFQLERSVEDLKRSNTNLEDFAYAASHDLKEPIRKIRIFTDRIKNDPDSTLSSGSQMIFSRLEAASIRMDTLVEDLLTYSRISITPTVENDVDLNFLLEQALEDLELEIEEKKAIITKEQLPRIKGHQRQLQQMLQNLLSNALKYTKRDIKPEITIRCKKIRGAEVEGSPVSINPGQWFYHISIADNGIGFEPEDAERIFHVFQRLHGNAEYKGTGIGLAIVRKVVENHRGYIWAESHLGKGATFHVLLSAE